MRDTGVPESVRRFLLAHVRSVEQLEVLLLLRSAPEQEWSAEEVSRELGSSVSSIRDRLAVLTSDGLVVAREEEGRALHRYEPNTEAARRTLEELATAYRERRLAVINLVYASHEHEAVSSSDE